jgi:hypothetical protein
MQRSNGREVSGGGSGRGLPSEAWDRLERVLERFEHAWRGGRRPDLDAYLADARAERLYLLVELVRADLEHRLGAGEQARVEAYLERYPELRDDREALLGLIAAEYGFRRRREPGCDPGEYLQRFPAYRQELTAWLQTPPEYDDRAARPDIDGTPPGAPAAGAPGGPGEDPDRATPGGPALRDSAAPPPTGPQLTPSPEGGTPARPAVPGYEVLGVLGQGGMGVVYQARHIALHRVVALKMILRGDHEGPEQRQRFRTEAEAVARLQHPNVVQIHEVGEHDGLPFFSLEFCPGGNLERKLGGTPLPPREAARLVQALARAMQAAHERGIVHRDLKPANVLLAADGAPKVTDFGLAKKLDDVGQTQPGTIVGTPSYMAPEQAGGRTQEVGPAADVYALGAILYECLTGRPPFKGATGLDTVLQVLSDDPVPPRQLQPTVPRDLETVCLKCLHKEPVRRYGTARELAEELARFEAGRPVRARPVGRLGRGWRWCRRNPAVAGLLAAVAAALLGGTAAATLFALRADANARRADREATAARESEKKANLAKADADREALQVRRHLYLAQMQIALRAYDEGEVDWLRDLLNRQQPARTGGDDLRGFEWYYLWRLSRAELLALRQHAGSVYGVAFSPDGRRLFRPDGAGLGRGQRTRGARTQGPHRPGQERGLQPRRPPPGQRLGGPDGAGLGRGQRRAGPRPPGTHPRSLLRGLQPRRPAPGQRLGGQDGAGLGCSHRARGSHPPGPHRRGL